MIRSTAEAVRQSLKGDRQAFDRLVCIYHRRILTIAKRYLGSMDAAEDATQEIFMEAWLKRTQLRSVETFPTWLYSLAIRHLLHRMRSDRAVQRRGDFAFNLVGDPTRILDEISEDDVADRFSISQDLKLIVNESIGNLPEGDRVVVILTYCTGCTNEEIATELGIPLSSVKTRLRRARQVLQRELRGTL